MKKKTVFNFVILGLFVCLLLTGCTKKVKLNETVEVKSSNIKITIHESEKYSVDDDELLAKGDYIKVKLTIENCGSEEYSWNALNFALGDEIPALNTLALEDAIPTDIAAGEKETGYIYFKTTDAKELKYTSDPEVSNGKAKSENVIFKIS